MGKHGKTVGKLLLWMMFQFHCQVKISLEIGILTLTLTKQGSTTCRNQPGLWVWDGCGALGQGLRLGLLHHHKLGYNPSNYGDKSPLTKWKPLTQQLQRFEVDSTWSYHNLPIYRCIKIREKPKGESSPDLGLSLGNLHTHNYTHTHIYIYHIYMCVCMYVCMYVCNVM